MQYWLLHALAAVALCIGACDRGGGSPEDRQAIVQAFNNYKNAIANGHGDRAAALVDSNTLQFYEICRQMALKAPEPELKEQGLMYKLTVLMLRHSVPVESLRAMNATELVAYAVDAGLVGENVDQMNAGIIEIKGDEGRVLAELNGKQAPSPFIFRRQKSGAWKLDITTIFPVVENTLKQAIKQQGDDENQVLVQWLEAVQKKPVPETIWQPLAGKAQDSATGKK